MVQTEELRILLRTVADTTGAQQTREALRTTQTEGARSLTAVGVAAGVGSAAVGVLAQQVGVVSQAFGESIQVAREHERVIRATSMAYGQAAGQYREFATQLEATTGFTSDAILEAALSARTLSQNYGLSIQQTQKLIAVSADLARVRGIGIAEAFERVQSAIRGEAEASEYLGLTLNDTYLTNQAMNGSLKNTFGTMTDLEKAQVRYNELLKQSAQFTGLAAAGADSLDAAFNRAGTSAHNLELRLGDLLKRPTIEALRELSNIMNNMAKTGEDVNAQRFGAFLQNLGGVLDKLRQDPSKSLVDIIRDVQAAGEAANTTARQQDLAAERARTDIRERQQLLEAEANLPRMLDAAELKRLAIMDQLQAATRDLVALNEQSVALQQESTQLAGEEARIKLSLLPAQQQMAALQRDMTEQQLRARQAALPATEALEDLRYLQERARLIASNRAVSPAERLDARRSLRELARAAPGVELAALDAERGLVPSSRAATRLGIQAQLLEIANQRALAGVTGALTANQFQQTITAALVAAQQQFMQDLARQLDNTKPVTVTVNITHEDGRVTTYTELIEANNQAQLPPIVPQSGVRRAG